MALERYRALSREIKEQAPGFETGLQIVDDLVNSLQKRGLLPKTGNFLKVKPDSAPKPEAKKYYPEIPLDEEHKRQALILAGRFAGRLGMSDEAYIATLPQFPERPSNYSELGLNVPVIVETRVPWMEAAELSGIFVTDYLKEKANAKEVSDWGDDKFEMPQVPFSAWAQDGTRFVYRKPSDVREELGKGENKDYRAGRIIDSIAIWNVHPDIIKTLFWDIIGTMVGSDDVPDLDHWDGRPELHADQVDSANPDFRALVLGREIRTLDLAA